MLLTFVSTMALLSVCLCVYSAHAVHVARTHTLHYRAVAAVVVKLLMVCCAVASYAV